MSGCHVPLKNESADSLLVTVKEIYQIAMDLTIKVAQLESDIIKTRDSVLPPQII